MVLFGSYSGTLESARVVEVLLRLTDGSIPAPPFDCDG